MDHRDLLSFGPYLLDIQERRVTRDGADVRISSRHFDLLCYPATHADVVVSKETLIKAAWDDTPVTTGSVDQGIFALRQALPMPAGEPLIETQARRGIRFLPTVTRVPRHQSDDSLDAVLEAHRIWFDGRAALETLNVADVVRARAAFERVVAALPERASAHVGLANACALQFEMTRTDAAPDTAALKVAVTHALQARHLDPKYGEAWATLGFVLERVSHFGLASRLDALGALQHAVLLEPDNWRHWFRLAACACGEERLRAARRALELMPGLALAHVLIATVFVARGLLAQALHELQQAVTAMHDETNASPYGCPAVYWLTGLIHLALGHHEEAMDAFQRELDCEHNGHLYANEVASNTWYAIGAARYHAGDHDGANAAFRECLSRVAKHPMARAALGETPTDGATMIDRAFAEAILLTVNGDATSEAAPQVIERAFAEAPAGNGGWLLPVEPMLMPWTSPDGWRGALARVRSRAA